MGSLPQSKTAVSSSVGVPFGNGLQPTLEVGSLDDIVGERGDRHGGNTFDRAGI